jgi:hypothetical protein
VYVVVFFFHLPQEVTVKQYLNCSGDFVQLGNVWIGVQPMLGVEGDPMRYAAPVCSLARSTVPVMHHSLFCHTLSDRLIRRHDGPLHIDRSFAGCCSTAISRLTRSMLHSTTISHTLLMPMLWCILACTELLSGCLGLR